MTAIPFKSLSSSVQHFLDAPIAIYPLVSFRILFGLVMAFGTLRTWSNGWIEKLYLEPDFFFHYYGFHWIPAPSETGIYLVFLALFLSALGIAAGLFYRLSTLVFFSCFSYKELIDASNYLNHYYLVILFAFLLIFMPANRFYSLDVAWRKLNVNHNIPAFYIYILIAQLCIVYTCAGISKLNYDWLVHALPLRIWLPDHSDMPILGYFFKQDWCAYLFSWTGTIYDLTIAYFLGYRKTRPLAYVFVLGFHFMTYLLFNIGLFPLIMVTSTLIFFSGEWHGRLYGGLSLNPLAEAKKTGLVAKNPPPSPFQRGKQSYSITKATKYLFLLFFILQLVLPFRQLAYPNNLFWSEEGYRFGWRVMLVEKTGFATFTVHNPVNGQEAEIINSQYLTPFQEKQMAIQPDFILQFAHLIAEDYQNYHGIKNPIVTVESFVAMNGRASQRFIDPKVNLAEIDDNLTPKNWVLPYKE